MAGHAMMGVVDSMPDLISWQRLTEFANSDKLVEILCAMLGWHKELLARATGNFEVLKSQLPEDEDECTFLPESFEKKLRRTMYSFEFASGWSQKIILKLEELVGENIEVNDRNKLVNSLRISEVRAIFSDSSALTSTMQDAINNRVGLQMSKYWV